MKKLNCVHNLGRIKIREYYYDDKEWGDPTTHYFTASINGWKGFKFISETLKPQQLLEYTYEACKKILYDLDMNGDKTLENYNDTIILNEVE